MGSRRAVFIDRDGTLSEEIGYINLVSGYSLLPRSAEAVRMLNERGIAAVLVTNQAGVARGYFPEERIHEVHARMSELLAEGGAKLDGVYYCPHHPTAGEPPYRMKCDCRKPEPGLLIRAAEELDLDLEKSYMVGDKLSDVELAVRVGCRGVLVLTGYGRGQWENRKETSAAPDHVAADLYEAARWILDEIDKGCA